MSIKNYSLEKPFFFCNVPVSLCISASSRLTLVVFRSLTYHFYSDSLVKYIKKMHWASRSTSRNINTSDSRLWARSLVSFKQFICCLSTMMRMKNAWNLSHFFFEGTLNLLLIWKFSQFSQLYQYAFSTILPISSAIIVLYTFTSFWLRKSLIWDMLRSIQAYLNNSLLFAR